MKKFLMILGITINIIVLSFCIEKIFYNSIILPLQYDYILWCNANERDYIKGRYGIEGKYNIIVCEVSWNREKMTTYKIKELPYGLGQKIEISSTLGEYVRENNNTGEVILKSIIPYTIIGGINIILIAIMIKSKTA